MNERYKRSEKEIREIEEEEEEEEEGDEEEETKSLKQINLKDDNIKCSLMDHKEINAIIYCQKCKVYMCNKCENYHSKLFNNHDQYNLDKDIKEIFTGYCKEKNHSNKLEYFCIDHNTLCCVSCLCKIKNKRNGQHRDCNVCYIKKIKNSKKNSLSKNIKFLEELSIALEQSIKELKKIFLKINNDKEKLKLNIQKIFTKLRNSLNNREDELLLKVDNQFNDLFFNEELIKESEKLPDKVKLCLEKGKMIDKDREDKKKLNSLVNDCINIENNIKNINLIKDKINICNSKNNLDIKFSPGEEDEEINEFFEYIKQFGKINVEEISDKK